MKYTDKELKVIYAKLQVGQLFLIKREQLNDLYDSINNLLQAIQDYNYGIANNYASQIQVLVNDLLPSIEPEETNIVDTSKNLVETPIGALDLENSQLGNLLKFSELAESRTHNSNKRKKKISNKNN